MPTPIGHTLAAVILYKTKTKQSLIMFMGLWFFALLPDIDFLFGFFRGEPNRYHHQFTHSLFFIIVCGIIGGWLLGWWRKQDWRSPAVWFSMAGMSHLLLDVLSIDQRPPYGCPLWWPFSRTFVLSPVLIFSDVSRASDNYTFFSSLWNWHNALTITIELLVLTPLLFVVWIILRRHYV